MQVREWVRVMSMSERVVSVWVWVWVWVLLLLSLFFFLLLLLFPVVVVLVVCTVRPHTRMYSHPYYTHTQACAPQQADYTPYRTCM